MNERQAREELNNIATQSFNANISNPDAIKMDNSYFVDMHINQISKESRGDWDWTYANQYINRLSKSMKR